MGVLPISASSAKDPKRPGSPNSGQTISTQHARLIAMSRQWRSSAIGCYPVMLVFGWSTAGPGLSGGRLPGPAVIGVRPSRPGRAAGDRRGRDSRSLVARGARVGRDPGLLPSGVGISDASRREGGRHQFAGQVGKQHSVGLVEVESRRDQHPAHPPHPPEQHARAAAAAASAVLVDRVVAQQRMQCRAGPPRHRTDPTIVLSEHCRCQQGLAQPLLQQGMAGLMHACTHTGCPDVMTLHPSHEPCRC